MFKVLLFLLISFIPLAKPRNEINEEQFMEEIDRNYGYYMQVENASNDYFSMIVVKGIYNDKASYGISFTSTKQAEYYLLIKTSGYTYKLITDSNQDSSAIAIDATFNIELFVYDKDDRLQSYTKELESFKNNEVDTSSYIKGSNEGREFSALKLYSPKSNYYEAIIYVILSVICLSVIILTILFVKKKGMFDKQKRKEGVINMRELVEEETRDTENNDYVEIVKEVEEKNEMVSDIKAYLRDLGYITEYAILSEEDKNRIMLELIKLKNSNKINVDKYYEETYELWKK